MIELKTQVGSVRIYTNGRLSVKPPGCARWRNVKLGEMMGPPHRRTIKRKRTLRLQIVPKRAS